jgi:uncharacterized protein YndB with AHSA1/START domain
MSSTQMKTRVTTPGEREIHSEREFEAPRERVFELWTDAEKIPLWWGRLVDTTTVDEMDVRPGGRWRFVCVSPDGEHAFRGVYREVSPPERIVGTFEWEGMPGHVSVETTTFEDLGDGRTLMRSVSVFHTTEERDGMLASGMEKGQEETFTRLEELLAQD